MKKELVHCRGWPDQLLPTLTADALQDPASATNTTSAPIVRPDTPIPPLLAVERSTLGKKLGHHARYFEEREERELRNIKQTEMTNEKLHVDLAPVLEGIRQLSVIHDEMKGMLGLSDEEASNLVPAGRDPERPS